MGWVWFCIIFLWINYFPCAMVFSGEDISYYILAFLIIITISTIVIHIIISTKKEKKEKYIQELMMDSDFSQINELSPYDFEHWVARLMRIQGYEAHATKYSGDYGVDVIAEKDGYKIGIQVKKFNGPVGIKAVQEISSGINYYECHEGWVISTTPYFTKAAINLAEKNNITLFNKTDLAKYFKQIKKEYENNIKE